MQEESEIEKEIESELKLENYIHTSKMVSFFGLDARFLITVVLFAAHARVWTGMILIGCFAFFYILMIFNLDCVGSIKRLRLYLSMLIFSRRKTIL